jgi:ADP-ribose pyrophosphatase
MDMDTPHERRIGGREIFHGRIITVKEDRVELPDGRASTREVVLHPGAVAILPLDETGNIVMVRQFRYTVGEVLLEAPAGKLEPGEDPLTCAARELAEETGLAAQRLTCLTRFYTSPGFSNELIHLFLAEGLTQAKAGTADDEEFIEVVRVPLPEAVAMVHDGRIKNAITVIAVLEAERLAVGRA